MTKPILYSYWRSSCSWRVRIALALKGIEYENRPVNLVKGGQSDPEYLKLNPRGLVPALVLDGKVYTESMAIIEFLDEKFPDKCPLLPKSPEDRAVVRSLAAAIHTNIQPVQNLRVLKYVGQGDQAKSAAHANHFITLGFDALEQELSKTAGKYSFGDQVTLVDTCVPPQVYNAKRFNVDMSKYPTIARINEALAVLPAFIEADAWHQPDTPAEERRD